MQCEVVEVVRKQLVITFSEQLHTCAAAGTRRISACAPELHEVVRRPTKLPQAVGWPMVQRAGARCDALRVHTGRGGATCCAATAVAQSSPDVGRKPRN